MTTIYLIRHSETLKNDIGIRDINDDLLLNNIKMPLSVNGEKLTNNQSKEIMIHQINTYYNIKENINNTKLISKDNNNQYFYWININELNNYNIVPKSTYQLIKDNNNIKHFIEKN